MDFYESTRLVMGGCGSDKKCWIDVDRTKIMWIDWWIDVDRTKNHAQSDLLIKDRTLICTLKQHKPAISRIWLIRPNNIQRSNQPKRPTSFAFWIQHDSTRRSVAINSNRFWKKIGAKLGMYASLVKVICVPWGPWVALPIPWLDNQQHTHTRFSLKNGKSCN
jgi:hypothetical protein